MASPTPRREGLVAIFPDAAALAAALQALAPLGLGPDQLAVLGRAAAGAPPALRPFFQPVEQTPAALERLAERMRLAGLDEVAGAALGGLAGLVGSLLWLAVPGVGLLVLAGETALLSALTVASMAGGVGLGALLGALLDERLVERHLARFEAALRQGEWLLVLRDAPERLLRAEAIVRGLAPRHLDLFREPA
jgi:hypothetical protein